MPAGRVVYVRASRRAKAHARRLQLNPNGVLVVFGPVTPAEADFVYFFENAGGRVSRSVLDMPLRIRGRRR